jgi:hypothetical protein
VNTAARRGWLERSTWAVPVLLVLVLRCGLTDSPAEAAPGSQPPAGVPVEAPGAAPSEPAAAGEKPGLESARPGSPSLSAAVDAPLVGAPADGSALCSRRCIPPDPSGARESATIVVADRDAVLARHNLSAPVQSPPIVRVDDFGARGDGVTDDTPAIRLALRALEGGGTLVFSPDKTYRKTALITVDRPNIVIWGYGAVLYSVVTDAQLDVLGKAEVAVHLAAPRTSIYGLTLVSNMRGRTIGHPHLSGIWVSSTDQQVIDNRLEYDGIFVREAQRFVVARNVVYRSPADGIHVTTRSLGGKVVGNVVRETGDDMIAVVSYGLGAPNVGEVLIEDNDVSAQYWGRGISVVGGHDVEIRHNTVSRTPFGAGILVHSETSYKTSNVVNVIVEDNQISDVQTREPAYNPARKWKKTGHGAIDVYGQGDQEVSNVTISRNSIEDTDKDAIFVRGNSCSIDIVGNHAEGVGRDAVRIEINPQAACRIDCRDNSVTGAAKFDARCGVTQ